MIDVLRLREWCDRLCRLAATDVARVVAALDLTDAADTAPALEAAGPAPQETTELAPPTGATRCIVGTSGGRFRYLSLTFATPTIRRHTLEDAMGPGVLLRRTRPTRTHQVAYRTVIPDAPFSCDLLARFDRPPTDDALVTGVTLRRDRGVARQPG